MEQKLAERRAEGSLTDAQLLRRCRQSDQRAWSHLVERYKGLVYSTILRTGLGPDDAGDAFQDVWSEFHRSVHRIRNPDALSGWLVVSARRRAYKLAAKRSRATCALSESLVDPGLLPSEVVDALDRRRTVEKALAALGGMQATLIRLLFLTEPKPTYEEIAARTDIAVGSIGPLRARAIRRLRQLLEMSS